MSRQSRLTIPEAKELKAELANTIRIAVEAFEETTGLTVHNIYVYEGRKGQGDRVVLNVGLVETEVAP